MDFVKPAHPSTRAFPPTTEDDVDPVADVMFNRIHVHGFFLEYDSARTGSFKPLRMLPKGKTVVLGLASKSAVLEDAGALRRRIGEAAQYAPLGQLALSPLRLRQFHQGEPAQPTGSASKATARRRSSGSCLAGRLSPGTGNYISNDMVIPRKNRYSGHLSNNIRRFTQRNRHSMRLRRCAHAP